jgi:hypothetical protein
VASYTITKMPKIVTQAAEHWIDGIHCGATRGVITEATFRDGNT